MHTSEQAKYLRCPLVGNERCCANECAAWRWARAGDFDVEIRTEPHPFEAGKTVDVPVRNYKKSAFGFCGLAGRPEVW